MLNHHWTASFTLQYFFFFVLEKKKHTVVFCFFQFSDMLRFCILLVHLVLNYHKVVISVSFRLI